MDYIITEANKFEEKHAKPYRDQNAVFFTVGKKGKIVMPVEKHCFN